jgi:hypothetical protein
MLQLGMEYPPETEAGGLQFEVSLGYMRRPYLKEVKKS